jgi:hypothetical protein
VLEDDLADLFASEARKWCAVRETVEGRQSPSSCALSDGRIVFSGRPIPKSAKPNLKLLSEILRSVEPLPPVAREWLASLFDPDSDSDYHVETLIRRPKGEPRRVRRRPFDLSYAAMGWSSSMA